MSEYRELVSPQVLDFPGSVFYEPNFLDYASYFLKLDLKPVLCLANKQVVGLANYLVGGRLTIKTALIPRLFQYFGPVSLRDDPDIITGLADYLTGRIDSAIFSLAPETSRIFNMPGWRQKNRLTYFLRPDTFENMLNSCSRSSRKNAVKAADEGVEFKESDEFPYDIYQAVFSRQGLKAPLGRTVLENWIGKLRESGLARTFIAEYKSNIIASRTVLYYGKYGYYWLAGISPEYLELGAGNFLVLKIGDYFHRMGIKDADFVGGDIKSIAEFKKSFGSRPVEHLQVEKDFTIKGKLYRKLMKLRANFNA